MKELRSAQSDNVLNNTRIITHNSKFVSDFMRTNIPNNIIVDDNTTKDVMLSYFDLISR